jgi:hypothetical protein
LRAIALQFSRNKRRSVNMTTTHVSGPDTITPEGSDLSKLAQH